MRRLSYIVALLAASCGVVSPAFAQRPRHTPRARVDTVVHMRYELPRGAVAMTYCAQDENDSTDVVIAIDARALDSLPYLAEVLVHERQHQREMRANPRLCDPLPFQLLGMEVRAYCVDGSLAVGTMQEDGEAAYFSRLDDLLSQFRDRGVNGGTVHESDVRAAWFKECNRLLVRATPTDGTTVVKP